MIEALAAVLLLYVAMCVAISWGTDAASWVAHRMMRDD